VKNLDLLGRTAIPFFENNWLVIDFMKSDEMSMIRENTNRDEYLSIMRIPFDN